MATFDKYNRTVSADPGSRSAFPDGISQATVSGGPFVPQCVAFGLVAGAGGSADDVTLYAAALPYKAYLLKAELLTTTGVSMATVTLRTATAGAGSALSSAIVAATTGNLTASTGATAIGTALAAASTIVARRSDSGIAGVLLLWLIPTV